MEVFFIDPQSYYNLAIYDKSLISNYDSDSHVTFICSSMYNEGDIKGTTIIPLFKYNDKKGVHKYSSYLLSIIKIVSLILKQKPDIIHIQWFKFPVVEYLLYAILKKFRGFKLVFTAHNILPHNTGTKYISIYKKIYGITDAIIVHDKGTKSELSKLIEVDLDKIHVIRHGVLKYTVNDALLEKEIEEIKEKYKKKDNIILFSVIGNQTKYKGTDVLLDAWMSNSRIRNNDKCSLLIAGRSKDLNFSSLDNERNIYVENDFISDERLIAILKVSDVLLLPYKKISQSGVLLSAVEYGTPFLVTNVGGLSEPLSFGDVGWVIESCKDDLISNILTYLIDNPQLVFSKRNNSLEWEKVRKEYEWASIGKKTSTLYRSLIK